jgi:hypothetical protein
MLNGNGKYRKNQKKPGQLVNETLKDHRKYDTNRNKANN